MKYLMLLALPFITNYAYAMNVTISQATLLNPQLSAGENLRIQYEATTAPGHEIYTDSGASVYIGFIKQNIFPGSSPLNLESKILGHGKYEISNLVINPWAAPDREYHIYQFCVSETSGHLICLIEDNDGIYWQADMYDSSETPFKTNIPAMKFTVAPNPLADNVGPTIFSAKIDKSIYTPGDTITMQIGAKDDISGIQPTQVQSFLVVENGTFFAADAGISFSALTSDNVYAASDIRIAANTPPGHYKILGFSIMDRAQNWGDIRLMNPDDKFYTEPVSMKLTNIPVIEFEVKAK